MRLTLWTDYVLRTLIYLGSRDERFSTVAQIAESFEISHSHLTKIVNRLARQGYIETVRGQGGGIRLAREPQHIGIGALVREHEEELAVMGCLGRSGFCRIENCCILRRALGEATHAFLTTLDGYTLADLLQPRVALARSLGFPEAARP